MCLVVIAAGWPGCIGGNAWVAFGCKMLAPQTSGCTALNDHDTKAKILFSQPAKFRNSRSTGRRYARMPHVGKVCGTDSIDGDHKISGTLEHQSIESSATDAALSSRMTFPIRGVE